NRLDRVRPIPPVGINVPPEEHSRLQAGAFELGRQITRLHKELAGRAALSELLPDVQVYHNAVRYALSYNEFYNRREFGVARELLKQGMDRAAHLAAGRAPWASQTGLVVRGYVSHIDGSVQPYGLVVPPSYRPDTAHQFRLDVWCHGRGEKLT